MSRNNEKKLGTFLFNPFAYVAGSKALVWGLVLIFLAGLVGSWSGTHFDGVIDAHPGTRTPLWFFLSEGFVDWLSLAVVLVFAGKLVSKTSFRVVDVMGTEALARWPSIIGSLAFLTPGFHRISQALIHHLSTSTTKPQLGAADAAILLGVGIAAVLATCWMVYLMYKAFSVSCNVRGGKAVDIFIAALIVAEIVYQIGIVALALVG